MRTQFLLFLSTILAVLGLSTFYVVRRTLSHSPWAKARKAWFWAGAIAFLLLQFLGPWAYRTTSPPGWGISLLQWAAYLSLGIFACLFFYTLFTDLGALVWKALVRPEEREDVGRRAFFTSLGATGLSSAAGLLQALSGPKVFEVEVPLEGLPPEFEGFKIAQISDLHVGPLIGRDYVEKVSSLTQGLEADLVALTGDMVDGTVEDLRPALEPLASLKPPHGVHFVTGNHEYYWGAEAWMEEFRRMGAKVLQNEHVLLRRGKARLVLAGVTDLQGRRAGPDHVSDPLRALQGAPKDAVKLLLAHQPASYEAAHAAGFDLQLSGHTHAGQFFPWNLVVMAAQRYYKGLNRHGRMWVYVNRGTGYWGPPLRFLVPSEVTLLRLRKA